MGLGDVAHHPAAADRRRGTAAALERDGPWRGAHRLRRAGAVLARAMGALAVRRHRRAGDGCAVPVLDRERRRLSFRHARRCADLRLCGLHQARARSVGDRRAHRSGGAAGLELQPVRPGRSACPSSCWRWSASTSRATSPPTSSATYPMSGIRSSPARPSIRRTAPRRSSPPRSRKPGRSPMPPSAATPICWRSSPASSARACAGAPCRGWWCCSA